MILDVGCGDFPRGDINTDFVIFRMKGKGKNRKMIKTKANIICDGSYLPFKENCFNKVISHHTIEHTKNPFEFLKELVRVSKAYVNIRCPHRFSPGAKMPPHISYFDKKWFHKACKLLGVEVRADMSYSIFKLKYLIIPFFVRPKELIIEIYKK